MYRVDVRPQGQQTVFHRFADVTSLAPSAYSGRCGYDAIYSFRTGQSGANPVTEVHIPNFSSKPADNLRQLGNFYRDFSESATASSTVAAEEGMSRYSTGDVGHEMVSIKVRHTPLRGQVSNPVQRTPSYPIDLFADTLVSGTAGLYHTDALWRKYQDARSVWAAKSNVVYADPYGQEAAPDSQNVINSLFSQMRNNAPVINVGESIVELIRGGPYLLLTQLLSQFDSYIKLLKKPRVTTRQLKSLAGEAGGSYLYGTFAVAPFLNDVRKVLENLTTLHSLVYGSSSRQRRIMTKPTQHWTDRGQLRTTPPFGMGKTFGVSVNLRDSERNVIQSVDTRLVARFSGLARPTSQSKTFIDKAEALWYNLGMTEPTLVWDLTSFSWLLDWWIHLGSSITNAYAFSGSGVNVDYAYSTTRVRTLATQWSPGYTDTSYSSNRLVIPPGIARCLTTVTYRRRATPFGFGGDLSSLTSGQMSILTALGLAKTR